MAEPISVAIPIAPKVDLTGLPDKFSGQFFKRWQQRMKIWLTMKGLLTVIQVTRPEPTDTDPKTAEIAQWTERDQIGRGAILSALSNTLFDVYCSDSYTAKSLWDELDQNIILKSKGSKSILFLSSCGIRWLRIVDKFPKSWENFGMTLKHQKGRLSLDDLMIAISIEEEHRNQTHKMPVEHPRANLIVGKQRVNKINSNSKAINKGKTTKNKKTKKQTNHAGTVGRLDTGPSFVLIKRPRLGRQLSTWLWEAITGKTVSMGNSSTAEVLGIGSVDLKFPSGRILSLKRVHHVPTVRRNIISGSVIVREGYELAFKFNKVVIQQFGIFVGKVFLGYVETSYALRFLVIKSEIPGIEVNTIVEFRDAVFLEDVFPMKTGIPSSVSLDDSLASTSIPEHVEKMTNVGVNPNSASLTHEESDIPRRSKRARVVKDFGSDFVTYNIEDDPVTFKDAMASLEAKQWKEAVKSEMDSIVSNGTWVLVDLPPGCTTIGCKWIFKKKLKPDGSIDKFKARLVAKGFKQKEGIDYFDTYSR
ncbi:UNVERIFIED_CONTAM: Retrovirus-related Pol polyprotein from transposon RE1 [Sesamum angustifolium]|uniref:Retrovirus-related Pol polyprotein from transposon RE1 n=1 Tax=Sesamum angustifolium TaxID=2727405 RepID=A0AAW2RN78_9LAMI